MLTSPGATFPHIVRAPKVAGAIAVLGLIQGLALGLPQLTERGKAAALEMNVQQVERFTGTPVSDEQYEAMRASSQSNIGAYTTITFSSIGLAFGALVMTVILWAVFNAIMGGTATFKQVMSVVVHSQTVSTVSVLIAAPIMYSRGEMRMGGIANLGGLLPMLDETSVLARFLGSIDLFMIWWIVVLAIGLGVLYKRSTTGIATGLFIFYGVVALGLAFFLAR
jgi:hypothetical protein